MKTFADMQLSSRRLQHIRQAKPAYLARRRIKHKQVGTLLAVLPHFESVLVDVEASDLRERHAQRLVTGERVQKEALIAYDQVSARRFKQLVVFDDMPARLTHPIAHGKAPY